MIFGAATAVSGCAPSSDGMTISVTIGEGILTFSGWIRRRDSAFFTFMPSGSGCAIHWPTVARK